MFCHKTKLLYKFGQQRAQVFWSIKLAERVLAELLDSHLFRVSANQKLETCHKGELFRSSSHTSSETSKFLRLI